MTETTTAPIRRLLPGHEFLNQASRRTGQKFYRLRDAYMRGEIDGYTITNTRYPRYCLVQDSVDAWIKARENENVSPAEYQTLLRDNARMKRQLEAVSTLTRQLREIQEVVV